VCATTDDDYDKPYGHSLQVPPADHSSSLHADLAQTPAQSQDPLKPLNGEQDILRVGIESPIKLLLRNRAEGAVGVGDSIGDDCIEPSMLRHHCLDIASISDSFETSTTTLELFGPSTAIA